MAWLQDFIAAHPEISRNVLSVPSIRQDLVANMLHQLYNSGFIGVFLDREDQPYWARQLARAGRSMFFNETPGQIKRLGQVMLAEDSAGKCAPNFRHALELWEAGGRKGTKPYTRYQDTGSCVGVSFGEHMTTILGWRAARPEYQEEYKYPVSCHPYEYRGDCGDGWYGSGCAAKAIKYGLFFMKPYEGGVDLSGDDQDEQYMARKWCRTGAPAAMVSEAQANHAFEPGAVVQFQGGVNEIRSVLYSGGALHTGSTFTSGGSRPFTNGSVGPHMQSIVGMDDSEQFRQFCRDVLKVAPRDNDFPVVLHQTWGPNWSGECADQYWPAWWGPKPEGAWVTWASTALRYMIDEDCYVYLPKVRGFSGTNPIPPGPGPSEHPAVKGSLYVENGNVIRGELTLTVEAKHVGTHKYVVRPDGGLMYQVVPKPSL